MTETLLPQVSPFLSFLTGAFLAALYLALMGWMLWIWRGGPGA
jgi:hypothetical protein